MPVAEILTVGLPTLAVLVGILVNSARLTDFRIYIAGQFEAERRTNDARFGSLEARMDRLEARMDNLEKMLLGKIEDIDNRLGRLEERFGR